MSRLLRPASRCKTRSGIKDARVGFLVGRWVAGDVRNRHRLTLTNPDGELRHWKQNDGALVKPNDKADGEKSVVSSRGGRRISQRVPSVYVAKEVS